MENSRSVSLLDAICTKYGDSSTMKCVLLGLLGADRSFSPATIRCASAKIMLSCSAVMWALKSPGASCARLFCSCRNSSRRCSGSLALASYRRNAPSLGSGRPSKYRPAGCSRSPFSYLPASTRLFPSADTETGCISCSWKN